MKIFGKSAVLILLAYGLTYWLGLFLARVVGPDGFGDYSVAVAWSMIFTIVITLGLEKLGREKIPGFINQRNWTLYRGYLTFGYRAILLAGVVFAVIFVGSYATYNNLVTIEHNHPALMVVVLFLPITGLVRFLAELVNINKGFLAAIGISNLQPALLTLILVLLVKWYTGHMTAVIAIIAYGISWFTCIPLALIYLKKLAPKPIWHTKPGYRATWLTQSLPYLISSMAILASFKCGLIVLEMLHLPENIIGFYAAIDQILFFLVTASILSNTYFAPRISMQIHKNNIAQVNQILRQRFITLGLFSLLFCSIIFSFGRPILNFFGPEFVADYGPLCLGSVLTSIVLILYINSVLLQYLGYQTYIAKHFILIMLSNILVVASFAQFTAHPLYGTVIGVSVPTIIILIYQNLLLIKRYNINSYTLRKQR